MVDYVIKATQFRTVDELLRVIPINILITDPAAKKIIIYTCLKAAAADGLSEDEISFARQMGTAMNLSAAEIEALIESVKEEEIFKMKKINVLDLVGHDVLHKNYADRF
mmetsp:Transcript_5788/g.9521  ORF Transcript_5788/g.9521 Transcript_5788/m.9521 type:complete len:109 (-) Transcript_5788:311-637(-)